MCDTAGWCAIVVCSTGSVRYCERLFTMRVPIDAIARCACTGRCHGNRAYGPTQAGIYIAGTRVCCGTPNRICPSRALGTWRGSRSVDDKVAGSLRSPGRRTLRRSNMSDQSLELCFDRTPASNHWNFASIEHQRSTGTLLRSNTLRHQLPCRTQLTRLTFARRRIALQLVLAIDHWKRDCGRRAALRSSFLRKRNPASFHAASDRRVIPTVRRRRDRVQDSPSHVRLTGASGGSRHAL